MTRSWTVLALMLVLCLACSSVVEAQGMELDPLLELLVKRGVITLEEAEEVQAEYDLLKPDEVSPPSPAPDAPPAPLAEPAPETVEVADVATDLEPVAAPEKKEEWYDRIELKGDLRLRYEGFWIDGISDNNYRGRERIRVRPGIYSDVTDWMRLGFQLRSGDPLDPVSDNQSVDGGFSMKPIAISEMFAAFTPTDWLGIHAGKFDPKKLWKVSDMQWDDDVTVEGLLEDLTFGPFQASFYQYALEERKGGDDSFLYGGQARGSFDLGAESSLTVGAGYDYWSEPQHVADLTLSGRLGGNRVTNILDDNDQLISDFQIGNLFLEWKNKSISGWPITLTAFGYHNFGARGLGRDYDDGYFVRFQIGDYKEKGQMAFRGSRYYSQPDALFYVFSQSDTTMVSDVDGYRLDFRLGFVRKSYFNLTWYHTQPASDLEEVPTMDRLQVDYIIVF